MSIRVTTRKTGWILDLAVKVLPKVMERAKTGWYWLKRLPRPDADFGREARAA